MCLGDQWAAKQMTWIEQEFQWTFLELERSADPWPHLSTSSSIFSLTVLSFPFSSHQLQSFFLLIFSLSRNQTSAAVAVKAEAPNKALSPWSATPLLSHHVGSCPERWQLIFRGLKGGFHSHQGLFFCSWPGVFLDQWFDLSTLDVQLATVEHIKPEFPEPSTTVFAFSSAFVRVFLHELRNWRAGKLILSLTEELKALTAGLDTVDAVRIASLSCTMQS